MKYKAEFDQGVGFVLETDDDDECGCDSPGEAMADLIDRNHDYIDSLKDDYIREFTKCIKRMHEVSQKYSEEINKTLEENKVISKQLLSGGYGIEGKNGNICN